MDPRVLEYLAQKVSKMSRKQKCRAILKAKNANIGLNLPPGVPNMNEEDLRSLAVTCALLVYRHQEGQSLLGQDAARPRFKLQPGEESEAVISIEDFSDSTILKLVS